MNIFENDFDITKNIKIMEQLKSDLLLSVATLFENLIKNNIDPKERAEKFADIIMYSYLLSKKFGLDSETIDSRLINNIRLHILEDENPLKPELINLLKYFEYIPKN